MKYKKKFSLNLHLDSLGEAYGWPKNYNNDSAFTIGLERISKILKKYKMPITVFVIGKDLENERNVKFLKKFINENDVEIANHSYNHFFDLGSKSYNEIYQEINYAHDIIYKKLKITSKGFCSPTWTFSKNVINVLTKLNYNYDTSNFNSLWLLPMMGKIFLNHLINFDLTKSLKIVKRRDYLQMLRHETKPYFVYKNFNSKSKNKLLEIPMPSSSKFQIPIWHTIGFMFGFEFLKKQILNHMNTNNFLNYVIHPADILINRDLDKRYTNSLPRLDNNQLSSKIYNLERILEIVNDNHFSFIKMNDYFNNYVKKPIKLNV
ncbi:polysaccharide deacetylase family protein [bacterium]|nr:polysaccharide deacetylase family protein [bacterium]